MQLASGAAGCAPRSSANRRAHPRRHQDVLITAEVVGTLKIRLMDLLATPDVNVVDRAESICRPPRARETLKVLIDVNVGQNRTGRAGDAGAQVIAKQKDSSCSGCRATAATTSIVGYGRAAEMESTARSGRASGAREDRVCRADRQRGRHRRRTNAEVPGVTEIQRARRLRTLQQDWRRAARTRRSPTSAARCPCSPR